MNKLLLPQTTKNLPTDSLRMFLVLAEIKSISGTAQVISRSQPAVSEQLKKLETTLNTTLFRRNKGAFTLTRNGEILLNYAQQILILNDSLLEELSQDTNKQIVRLGIPNDFIQQFQSNTLPEFQEKHPDICFQIYEDLSINLMKRLHKNQLDIALTLLPKAGGQYCVHSVEKNLFWVGDSKLLKIQPLPIISCFHGCSYRTTMETALQKENIPFKTILTTNNFYTIFSSIRRGLGIYALINNKKNLEEYQPYLLDDLPELQPLHLGLHIKSVNTNETISELTKHIKTLM